MFLDEYNWRLKFGEYPLGSKDYLLVKANLPGSSGTFNTNPILFFF
jgi:hypothetical protein